jgi:catecholate siderophore receptor
MWHLDLGLRWDHVDIDYSSVATTGVETLFGRLDTAVTGRAGVVFKPKAEGSIYAAFSTSFAPGYDGAHGIVLAATGANSQALPPERSRNIEVGTKWQVNPELMLTAAAFDMRKTNAKTPSVSGAIVLAGEQKVLGLELGASGEINDQWSMFTGIAFMNGTVEQSGTSTELGAQLAYVPKTSANFWTTYRPTTKLMLGGGANFSDGHYYNQTGGYLLVSNRFDPRYVQNAAAIQNLSRYLVFNAVATYQLHPKVLIQMNLTNIGNEKYADRAYDRHFLPGASRQILIAPVITF